MAEFDDVAGSSFDAEEVGVAHETSDIALGIAAEGANGFNEDFAIHAVAVRDTVADGAFFIIYRHAVPGKLDMGGAQGRE